jgi:hypothetical protein
MRAHLGPGALRLAALHRGFGVISEENPLTQESFRNFRPGYQGISTWLLVNSIPRQVLVPAG